VKTVTASELKRDTASILNDVAFGGESYMIERHGKYVAEIIPKRERSSKNKAEIREALKKYYGAIPDFPEVHKERTRRRWKKIFDWNMYLLDTDVIIDHLRKRKFIDASIITRASISYFTLVELAYGAYRSTNQDESIKLFEDFINDLNIGFRDFDRSVVYEFASTKASLEKKGKKLADFDLLIAATAIVNNLILVTNNKKHFERIDGLRIYS
jgi:tRNA(fMet)-specific endonuclease VapC